MRSFLIYLTVLITSAFLIGCGGGGGGGDSTVKAEIALKVDFATDIRSSLDGKDTSIGALYSDGMLINGITLRYGRTVHDMTSVGVLSNVMSETPVTLTGLTLGATYIFSIEATDSGNTVLCSGTAEAVIASVTNVNLSCAITEADSYFRAYSPTDELSFVVQLSDVLPDGNYVTAGLTTLDNVLGSGTPFVSVYSKTMSHKVSKYLIDNNPSYIMDTFGALTHDESGNIYAVGLRYGSMVSAAIPVIIKFDSELNILWSREVEYSGLGLPESMHILRDAVSLDSGGIAILLENADGLPVVVKVSEDGDSVEYAHYETQLTTDVPIMPSKLLKDPSTGHLIIVGTASDSSESFINLMAIDSTDMNLIDYNEYFVANTASANAVLNYSTVNATIDGSGYIYIYLVQDSTPSYYPGVMRVGYTSGGGFSDTVVSRIFDNASDPDTTEYVRLAANDTNDTVLLSYARSNADSTNNNSDFDMYMINLGKDFSFNWKNRVSDPSGLVSLYGVGSYPLADGAFAVIGEGESYTTYYGGAVLAKLDREGVAGNFTSLSDIWEHFTVGSSFYSQFSSYTVMHRATAYTMSGTGDSVSSSYIRTLTNGSTSSYDFTDTFMTTVGNFINYLVD